MASRRGAVSPPAASARVTEGRSGVDANGRAAAMRLGSARRILAGFDFERKLPHRGSIEAPDRGAGCRFQDARVLAVDKKQALRTRGARVQRAERWIREIAGQLPLQSNLPLSG